MEQRVKIPKGVKARAQQARVLLGMGFKGMVDTGKDRAIQLSTQETVSLDDLRIIRNWYARHVITSRPSYVEWRDAGRPVSKEYKNKIRGAVAYLGWGADEGLSWVNAKTNLLNEHFGTTYTKITV